MSKIIPFHRPRTVNIVFLVCLAGSILFAVASELKAQKDPSYQARISAGPGVGHCKHVSSPS